jgi:cytochrome c2
MTGGTSSNAALGRSFMIDSRAMFLPRAATAEHGHRRIICRYRLPLTIAKSLGNPCHLRMVPAAVGISLQLPFEIAGIETGKPRRAGPVSVACKPVTGEAGAGRSGLCSAECNDAAVAFKPIVRGGIERASAKCKRDEGSEAPVHGKRTDGRACLFRSLAVLPIIALAACKPPPDEKQFMPIADIASGKAAIERVGCGSCHDIPGIAWPKGAVGPALDGLATRALIGGSLPNRPDVLAAYVRNAPALVPGAAMPAMPVSADEARDIAAYLYKQRAE